ncbi:hypothetical protein V5N11_028603 [Cardamine amara subsp. amara]|uniref:Chromo domain-containing protein n=1 Tax=Cardamine amara subsp. amara TaxID=228776 RepID=A0ABD1BI75_CARAN
MVSTIPSLDGSRIHSVCHVSLLKKRVGEDTPTSGILPPLRSNGFTRLNLEAILASRYAIHHGERVLEFHVKWSGLPIADATWEDAE